MGVTVSFMMMFYNVFEVFLIIELGRVHVFVLISRLVLGNRVIYLNSGGHDILFDIHKYTRVKLQRLLCHQMITLG